jgi:hypothetical protein
MSIGASDRLATAIPNLRSVFHISYGNMVIQVTQEHENRQKMVISKRDAVQARSAVH